MLLRWAASDHKKNVFRQKLEAIVRTVKEDEKLIMGVDMNYRVEKRRNGYEEVHGGHRYGIRKEDRKYILEMAYSFELVCMNTWFQKLSM